MTEAMSRGRWPATERAINASEAVTDQVNFAAGLGQALSMVSLRWRWTRRFGHSAFTPIPEK